MTYAFDRLNAIGKDDIDRFRTDGFLIVEGLLDTAQLKELREAFPRLFEGSFDTGIYPDEWYWREGISRPDATRHMANAWKANLAIASLALSEHISRAAAALAGWSAVKLGQDTIWWKPPNTKAVSYHQDSSFMDFLDPPITLTCWVALDETHREAGTLEYVPGSHRWPLTSMPDGFHAPDDYRAQVRTAAAQAGVTDIEPVYVEVPAGSCVFHCGEIWHGSGSNRTSDRMRRSIGIHMIPGDARFSNRDGGYIYRRYQITGNSRLDESFFPITWSEDGKRTGWIDEYCRSGRRLITD